jgi:hypothetical protein
MTLWPDGDLSQFWLPLLTALTDEFTSWGVWKNTDRAFAGIGDLDSIGPMEDWEAISKRHKEWAFSRGAMAVVGCDHAPEVLSLFAIFPSSRILAQFDACAACSWRGARLFSAHQVSGLFEMDPRGFRQLRPGAAALSIFLLNGVKRGGRLNHGALREKKVVELMNQDPEGVLAAARLFGVEMPVDALPAFLRGEPPRAAILRLEARAALRSLAHPMLPIAKARLRMVDRNRCPIQVAIASGRKISGDVEGWLELVAAHHSVARR